MAQATFETELRKLKATELCTLAQYLNESDYWKNLMSIVPEVEDEKVPLFSPENFLMIEQAIPQQKRNGAEIFLSEWSTTGRKRPTCKILLDLLVKLEFFKAADYLAVEVLKVNAPERPKQGPAALIDVSDDILEKMLQEQVIALEEAQNGVELSHSINYVENPPDMVPVNSQKVEPVVERSNIVESSIEMSDMMRFSETVKEIQKVPDEVPNMINPIAEYDANNFEYPLDMSGLQIVESGNIPLCVNDDDEIYSIGNNTTNYSTTTQSTVSSSSINDSSSALPTPSENDIPIAVLELSDKKNKNT